VLPDWVVREVKTSTDYVTRPLGPTGKTKRLYAAIRDDDADKPYMAYLLKLAREIPVRLQRGDGAGG
jgi:LysR family transcriptional regulator for metE and metH